MVAVIDEEDQFEHIDTVRKLHRTVYSRPFVIPPTVTVPALSAGNTTSASHDATFSTLSSPLQSLPELPSSEWSEVDIPQSHLQLRDPAKLRSSQLTDSTYRQYVLDYMTQETVRILEASPAALRVLPEYAEYLDSLQIGMRQSTRSQRSKRETTVLHAEELVPFTITDILDIPHLHQLATLVVDAVARKEEKRRRRRVLEGSPRPGDLEIDIERKRAGRDWRLTPQERQSRMCRLTSYIIRGLATDGAIVHVQDGYLPLPPILVFPLLAPHFEREAFLRLGVYMRKTDPRYGHGATAGEIVSRMRSWGEDGRWERISEWVIQDAIGWGDEKGLVKKQGLGWWLAVTDA